MPRMRNWIEGWIGDRARWLGSVVAVAGLGVAWIWTSAVPPAATTGGVIPSPREGFAAPAFTLERLGGEQISLAELRGKVVVINLWASWCPPCRAEMPAIQRLYAANRGRGLEVLAINTTYQDSQAAAESFVREYGLTFPVLLDRTGEVSRLYHLRALPSTYFVDREGVIRQVIIGGPMSAATLETAVQDLLEEGS